ncbi:fibronectin type III-like domain-containing protein [Aspergillus stella-maris]|uniref:fibronectin type III-like domain-containing protein n=1 Tax=Aspergillus stella-maris TaxID=1810926 RepID=UPI003CCD302D
MTLYGLSYTTFDLSSRVRISSLSRGSNITSLPPAHGTVPGANPHLWDILYSITASVKNTGNVAGATVPQLYLTLPALSPNDNATTYILRGFEKVRLGPGETQDVTFALNRRDISRWDVVRQQWAIPRGEIGVAVGFSSRDFRARGVFVPIA